MNRAVWPGCVTAFVVASALVTTAQIGGKPVIGGNPTPGTPQPEPPNLNDRITLTGCLQSSPSAARAEPADANTPSDTRFVLAAAERVERVPPETGGSPLAPNPLSRTYRLEGLDSQFSPFTNTKVEISGEVKLRATSGTPSGPSEPTLLVEFVQRIDPRC